MNHCPQSKLPALPRRAGYTNSLARKDKTLVEILERIRSLEGKIDSLTSHGLSPLPSCGSTSATAPLANNAPLALGSESLAPLTTPSLAASESASSCATIPEYMYRYTSSAHQMLDWPVFKQHLGSVIAKVPYFDSATVKQDSLSNMLDLHSSSSLPREPVGPFILADHALVDGLKLPVSSAAGAMRLPGSPLTCNAMHRLTDAYFGSFNYIYPILDRHVFISKTLDSFHDGFDESISSILAFLVFALGELAIAGMQGVPVDLYHSRPSGIKGGTIEQPPGLALFNEARRRMGFALTDSSLENAQVFALAGFVTQTPLRGPFLINFAACTAKVVPTTWQVPTSRFAWSAAARLTRSRSPGGLVPRHH